MRALDGDVAETMQNTTTYCVHPYGVQSYLNRAHDDDDDDVLRLRSQRCTRRYALATCTQMGEKNAKKTDTMHTHTNTLVLVGFLSDDAASIFCGSE